MNIDELKCPMCDEFYNEKEKIPRLLINCGHTYCNQCIQDKLIKLMSQSDNGNYFKCPEDQTAYYNIISTENLPKNLSLIKLIAKNEQLSSRRASQSMSIQTKKDKIQIEDLSITIPPRNTLSSERQENLSAITYIVSPMKKEVNMFNKEDNIPFNPDVSPSDYSMSIRASIRKSNVTSSHKVKYCKVHPNRPLEVICLDDKVKICTSCALFGDHRNHNIINEEDFIKEIEVKAEILIDLFELIDQNINSLNEGTSINRKLDQVIDKLEDKYERTVEKIKNFYFDLRNSLVNQEKKIIDELNEKVESTSQKLRVTQLMPKDLMQRSSEWKKIVQTKLDKLNEISDPTNECLSFIDHDYETSHNVLIENAEQIISEYEKIRNFPVETINKAIEYIEIEMNQDLARSVTEKDLVKLIPVEENLNLDTLLKLDEYDQRFISIIGGGRHLDSTTTKTGSDLNFFEGNTFIGNITEESALINIANSIFQSEEKMERNYTTNNLGRNSGKFDSGNQSKSNKSTTSSTQLAQLNTFKITSRNEKSKSPGKKSDKDKIVFIKAQMKNDSANFTGYDIGDEGSKQIAEILLTKTTKVKELKLTKCNITDEGAIQILKAMETNSSVSSLNMSKNNITDKSVDAFVNMFNKNKSLKNILLSNNNLTSVAKDKIKSYSGIQGLKIFI